MKRAAAFLARLLRLVQEAFRLLLTGRVVVTRTDLWRHLEGWAEPPVPTLQMHLRSTNGYRAVILFDQTVVSPEIATAALGALAREVDRHLAQRGDVGRTS